MTPAQTTCNYVSLLFRNLGSALSEGDAVGTFLRTVPIVAAQLPNSEVGPSSAPANGPPDNPDQQVTPIRDTYLHSNPYPNTAAPGQTKECESGLDTDKLRAQAAGHRQRPRQPGHRRRQDQAGRRQVRRNHSLGMPPLRAGLLAILLARGGRLLRVHEGRPVPAPLRDPGGRQELQPAAAALAGAHRRRQRRRGRAQRPLQEHQPVGPHAADQRQRPADPPRRDAEGPPAPLPRGQLLRRPQAGHAERRNARRPRDDPDHADRDAGAARPGAHRAAVRHARLAAGGAQGPRRRVQREADRCRGRRAEPGGARPQRRPGAQQDAGDEPAVAARHRAGRRRAARPQARTTSPRRSTAWPGR